MSEYTREQILAMEAGRELDALVAEHIFGFTRYEGDDIPAEHLHLHGGGDQVVWLINPHQSGFRRYCKLCGDMPMFSEDISAAWEAWEYDRPDDWQMDISCLKGEYTSEIIQQSEEEGYRYLAQVSSKSAAEAMVKCRLLAVMNL